ncbi:hypothetical protein SMACR_01763 [Sordaria macrospora]|uniref:WGS project CABT00000000 data, contig 2.5 n=2 Tax=Sordaria macrospora TaxID=5147 RepID=F7VRS9_SORMK|nr:uncharacterized protein SMAC_01763 [Sordaria macrospora k-hell]KAA8635834.1 hypothetical protein SMACR_01763 [Sordaria macrospora]KAH7626293.1 hypothetical protein B0T09DRAFT_293697 [Sordaria sp. MPI-SDFR-AT-0083]WPJ61453.1 hypothetical protein SMAC4_01763 [Sordaria macrospora]CCC08215.1 unnamed protein product [Sordaria macrospora k-hell]
MERQQQEGRQRCEELESFLRLLGNEIKDLDDADEETYDLYAQNLPSSDLGIIDPKTTELQLTVAGRELTIHQSPGILSSARAGGTTGAVTWRITPLFVTWISSPSNPLSTHLDLLSPQSTIIELGAGTSAIVGLLLAPRVSRYVLTDQNYVAKLVEKNVSENWASVAQQQSGSGNSGGKSKKGGSKKPAPGAGAGAGGDGPGERLVFKPLDWETDTPTSSLAQPVSSSFDLVVACDCIYNEALVDPFVTTCADICRLRSSSSSSSSEGDGQGEGSKRPTVVVVAQVLRNSDVFETWIKRFVRDFRCWRVPDEMMIDGLKSEGQGGGTSGFVVHVGVLREGR